MGPSFWTSSLDEAEAREACRNFLAWFSSVIPSTCFNSLLKTSMFDFWVAQRFSAAVNALF
jgi:hypothetical protein